MKKRIFAIGDVHGCVRELELLLEKISPTPRDELIFIGDLINRGPKSKHVLDLVMSLPNTKCLIGNHEYKLLKCEDTSKRDKLRPHYLETARLLSPKHWEFRKSFKKIIYKKKIDTLFLHGGLDPSMPWQKQKLKSIVNIQVIDPHTGACGKRSQFMNGIQWANYWLQAPFVVYGHTPNPKVYKNKFAIGIDTGCVYGGCLTAFEAKSQTIYQVKSKMVYSKPTANVKY